MNRIQLSQAWRYDPDCTLGKPGGFGAVFAGLSEGGEPVAVKRLKLEVHEAMHRERRMADWLMDRELHYVIPVLDAGLDPMSARYFVVMPRAEKSLEDDLQKGNTWEDKEAAEVLLAIAEGLSEVQDIVHRDLKPANVLYHCGKWKVADFGIARFVEESTSSHTLKRWWSPPYAAPEQWLEERSTGATDIYAIGCIGYAILTGHPPFQGPDYRGQHLGEKPQPLEEHHPRLYSLLSSMLRKTRQNRPDLERVKKILKDIAENRTEVAAGNGFEALANADVLEGERQAKQEAEYQAESLREKSRGRMATEAFQILEDVLEEMFRKILRLVQNAERPACNRITHGLGMLEIDSLRDQRRIILTSGGKILRIQYTLPHDLFLRVGWDVVTGVVIRVKQASPEYERSAVLWYGQVERDGRYCWWEVSYIGVFKNNPKGEPFALEDLQLAAQASGLTLGPYQIAEGPMPIDGDDAEGFFRRWAGLLAKASLGKLQYSSS